MKRHGRALQASHRLTDSIIAVVGLQHKQSGMRRCLQMRHSARRCRMPDFKKGITRLVEGHEGWYWAP